MRIVSSGTLINQSSSDLWTALLGRPLPGIPYPTDSLPAGIQTSTSALQAPVPGGKAGWPYDPCTYTPNQPAAWPGAESPGSYYVDPNHPASTDTSNTWGYPNKPRKTLTGSRTFDAGAYVVFASGTHSYTSATWTCNGTAAQPVYFSIDDTVTIDTSQAGHTISGTHVILDGGNYFADARPRLNFSGQFFSVRHAHFEGNATAVGGQCIWIQGTQANRSEYLMVFDCSVTNVGVFPKSGSQDCHFFQPHWWTSYMWVIGCTATKVNADFIQCANSYNSVPDHTTPAVYPHYVFVGGNDVSQCGEQALDCKGSYHVIASSNKFWFQDVNAFTGADVDNVTLSNNTESDFSGPKWFLFNEVFNSSTGNLVRDSGTCNDDRLYIIGNVLYQTDARGVDTDWGGQSPGGVDTLTRNRFLYVVNNTIAKVGMGYNAPRIGDPSHYFFELHGNIIANCSGPSIWFDSSQNNIVTKNCYWNSTGPVSITTSGTAGFQPGYTQSSELYNSNPQFASLAGNDFHITSGSPCIGFCTEHAAYQTFEDWYGLDIRVDKDGRPRPSNGVWTTGAYEP